MRAIKMLTCTIITLMLSLLLFSSCSSDDPPDNAQYELNGTVISDASDYEQYEETGISDNNYEPEAYEQYESPEASSSAFPFPFTAYDLHGNHVTEAVLGDKDMFFVFYWSTWCPSCIQALPELTQLASEFGDRMGFISLQGDFFTARDAGIRIVENAEVPFITVPALHHEFQDLMELLRSGFVPTSVIIDRDGNVIGDQIVGRGLERFQSAIEYALGR